MRYLQLILFGFSGFYGYFTASSTIEDHLSFTGFESILKSVHSLSLYLRKSEDSELSAVQFFLQQNKWPKMLFVGSPEEIPQVFLSYRDKVITSSMERLRLDIKQFSSRYGNLFVILTDAVPVYKDIFLAAQETWNDQQIYKIYYITTNGSLFYNPFDVSSIEHIKLVNSSKFGKLVSVDILPINNIFQNLNGYPLRTYIFHSVYAEIYFEDGTITHADGADSEIAYLLQKKMNFSLILQWPDDDYYGHRLENGSYDGALGRMIRQETDITMTGFFIKDYHSRDIEFTVSVYMDQLCCYVMNAKRIPQAILPLFAVNIDMWLGFILAGIFASIIWATIRRINLMITSKERLQHLFIFRCIPRRQYVCIFIDTWLVWVRINISRYPPFYSERIFVISLCLVSVIFGAIFESSLSTVYIRPLYYKNINSMKELDEANMNVYIKHAAIKDDLFVDSDSAAYESLNKKLIVVSEQNDRLIEMASKRGGFSAVTRASSLVVNDMRYFITKKIHRIPECPKTYHISFLLQKHSPYQETINALLLRFLAAGLIDNWIEIMIFKSKLSLYSNLDNLKNLSTIPKVLTILDLQLSFYILFIGSLVAFLTLIFEIHIKNYCKIRKRKQQPKSRTL